MKGNNSIQISILSAVSVSLLLLAGILIFAQTLFGIKKSSDETKALVLEQVSLIVDKLDRFNDVQRSSYITRAVYDLKQVDAINVFDKNCELIEKQPINYFSNWDCKSPVSDRSFLIYEATKTMADSPGSPKYIAMKLKGSAFTIFNFDTLVMVFITFFAVIGTILYLIYQSRKLILNPLKQLLETVNQRGTLIGMDNFGSSVPNELIPIYESIFERDEVIQRSKEELLEQRESSVTAKISRQVAHDIRFPIMLLRDFIFQKKYLRPNFDDSLYGKAIGDLEALTGQLLEKSEDFKREIDVGSLLKEVVEMKQLAFEGKSISIRYAPYESCKVFANETKLKFVLSNIINNACEAIPLRTKGLIDISISIGAEEVILKISDNGKGISSENLERVFEHGVSIGKPGGRGLGLSNAMETIEKLNGQIQIYSEVGIGTTVTICLPKISSGFLCNGKPPYSQVFIEDFKLTQLLWLETAKELCLNFAVFSNPDEFERHQSLVAKNARIFVDSHFPDYGKRGEDWAKDLVEYGFNDVWLCSTDTIDVSGMAWIRGVASKERPFEC